jgi:hypothetical protein
MTAPDVVCTIGPAAAASDTTTADMMVVANILHTNKPGTLTTRRE